MDAGSANQPNTLITRTRKESAATDQEEISNKQKDVSLDSAAQALHLENHQSDLHPAP